MYSNVGMKMDNSDEERSSKQSSPCTHPSRGKLLPKINLLIF